MLAEGRPMVPACCAACESARMMLTASTLTRCLQTCRSGCGGMATRDSGDSSCRVNHHQRQDANRLVSFAPRLLCVPRRVARCSTCSSQRSSRSRRAITGSRRRSHQKSTEARIARGDERHQWARVGGTRPATAGRGLPARVEQCLHYRVSRLGTDQCIIATAPRSASSASAP